MRFEELKKAAISYAANPGGTGFSLIPPVAVKHGNYPIHVNTIVVTDNDIGWAYAVELERWLRISDLELPKE